MLSALKQIFSPSASRQRAHDAYLRIVAQARQPVFYRDWQVEDSLDGRFDMIVLHLYLVLARCEGAASEEARQFHQSLSEVFFADMDRYRMKNFETYAAWIAARGPLRVTIRRAAEIMWALASPDVGRMLCDELGWTEGEHARWLADTLERTLLPRPAANMEQ